MRAAVLGAGVISGGHCASLRDFGCEMVAIVDPVEASRKQFQQEFGFEYAFTGHREVLDKNIDVVIICTPNAFHAPAAIDFMNAGAHVICEKPMARTVEECDRMIEAAQATGRRLFVSHSQQFSPVHRQMIEDLKNGKIGRPFMAKADFIGDEFKRMNDPGNWKGTKEISGGGVLIDNGVHMINLLVAMFGKAKEVVAMCDRLVVESANKGEDSAQVVIFFENGVMAQVTVTFAATRSAWPSGYCGAAVRVEVLGTEGALMATNDLPNYQLWDKADVRQALNSEDIPIDMNQYFLKCIVNDEESILTNGDARHTIAIVEAAYRSAEDGRKVQLSEIG